MEIERLWLPRLRWRMRGAWQWPAFAALTVFDGFVIADLPFSGRGPGDVLGGMLLAGFFNLFAVAVIAPLAGMWVRRRRTDLPRLVANDYAGTAALAGVAVSLLLGGLVHRPAVAAEKRDVAAVMAATSDYVLHSRPDHRGGLAAMDAIRLEQDLYRSCVPGADPRRWLCLFVNTTQRPAGVTVDTDQAPNSAYREHGGFR